MSSKKRKKKKGKTLEQKVARRLGKLLVQLDGLFELAQWFSKDDKRSELAHDLLVLRNGYLDDSTGYQISDMLQALVNSWLGSSASVMEMLRDIHPEYVDEKLQDPKTEFSKIMLALVPSGEMPPELVSAASEGDNPAVVL